MNRQSRTEDMATVLRLQAATQTQEKRKLMMGRGKANRPPMAVAPPFPWSSCDEPVRPYEAVTLMLNGVSSTRPRERTGLRGRPNGQAPMRYTLTWSVGLVCRLKNESTDHFEGIEPVPIKVRPEPRRPRGDYRSPIIANGLQSRDTPALTYQPASGCKLTRLGTTRML